MKKSLLSILALALVAVGCQNYDDQFDSLNADIAALTTKVNGLDAGVAAQVTAVAASVANLGTQVTALGSSALTTTDLTTALSGVLSNIATVSAALTALDTSVATQIAGTNTNVAALQTTLTSVQSSALTAADVAALDEVANLNAEMVAVQSALDELLAAQASVNGAVSITNQAELDYVKTLIETDGTPANYIINGALTITTTTAASYTATDYMAQISAITGKIASVIGAVNISTVSSTAALDISQLTYVSGALSITGKMPSGFSITTAASFALDVEEADITLPTLTSAAAGVTIANTGNVTITNVNLSNLINGAVITAANKLELPSADVNLGAGHPATTTTVKSLIAGNATTALAGATITASAGDIALATKVVGTSTIKASGNITLSSGVTGSSYTETAMTASGTISVAALSIGAGTSALTTDGLAGAAITIASTSNAGALTATASGSTISAGSMTSSTGAMVLNATGVTLTGLATMTAALTVGTATSLSLPALVNTASANIITGAAVTTFSAPKLITAANVNIADSSTFEVSGLGLIGHLVDIATVKTVTLGAQDVTLDLSAATAMTTLNYTGKTIAAGANSAEATNLTVDHQAGVSSLTSVVLAGGMNAVVIKAPLMTSLTTGGFIRTFTTTGTALTSITVGHQGLNGGATSGLSITGTSILNLDLSNMKWIGAITVTGNASLTSITMPTATAAADNANVTNAAGGVAVSIGTNSLTGVWSDAIAASGSNLYAEGTFSTAPGIIGAKTWLSALLANNNAAVVSVTYSIEIDDAEAAMRANSGTSTVLDGDNPQVIDNQLALDTELALLPN